MRSSQIKELLTNVYFVYNQLSTTPISLTSDEVKKNGDLKLTTANDPEIYNLEKMISVNQLTKILTDLKAIVTSEITEKELKPLEDFLSSRWERIRGTDLAYPHSKSDAMTMLCMSIAQTISVINGKSIYEILMPTLDPNPIDFVTYEPLSNRFKEHEFDLQQIVLSDDDKRIIDVNFSLSSACEEGQLNHTTQFIDFPQQIKPLSPSEQQRVTQHSIEAKELYEAIKDLLKIKKEGVSIGSFIKRLIDQLRRGGAYNGGKGTQLESAEDANIAIFYFSTLIESLTTEEKNTLFKLNTGKETIGSLWGRLSRPYDTDFRDTKYCVALIANHFESILQLNPQLYTQYPKKTNQVEKKGQECKATLVFLEEKEARVKKATEKLRQTILKHNYKVTATYGDLSKTQLKERIFTIKTQEEKLNLITQYGLYLSKTPTQHWYRLLNQSEIKNLIQSPHELGTIIAILSNQTCVDILIQHVLTPQYTQNILNSPENLQEFLRAIKIKEDAIPVTSTLTKDFLIEAVDKKDYALIQQLLNAGLTPNKPGKVSAAHAAVLAGEIKIIEELSQHNANFNLPDQSGKSAIQLAIENKQWEIAAVMLKADLNLMQQNKWSLAHIAAWYNHAYIIPFLVNNKENINQFDEKNSTPAYLAAIRGNKDVLKQLAVDHVDFHKIGPCGKSPMMIAVSNQNLEMVAAMLRLDYTMTQNRKWTIAHMAAKMGDTTLMKMIAEQNLVDLNTLDRDKWTLADIAANNNHAEIIKILALHQANIDKPDDEEIRPIQLAADQGNLAALKVFIECKVNINSINKRGDTALHMAIKREKMNTTKELLLQNGIDLSIKDLKGLTPLALAINQKKWAMAAAIVLSPTPLVSEQNTESELLLAAVIKNETNTLKQFNKPHLLLDTNNSLKKSPLIYAVEAKKPDEFALMLNLDPKIVANKKWSYLHMAVEQKKLAELKEILKCNLDMNVTDQNGETPIHLAVKNGRTDELKELLKHNLDINITDQNGETPIHIAVKKGDHNVIKLLADAKANINLPNSTGKTPALLAIQHNHRDALVQLMNAKVDIFEPNSQGESAALIALKTNQKIFADIYNLTQQYEKRGWNAAHVAAKMNHVQLLNLIAEQKLIDLNTRDKEEWTLADIAAFNDYAEIIKVVNKYQADINLADKDGLRPIHLTAQRGNINSLQTLIECKVNVNLTTNQDETLLHLAVKRNHLNIINELILQKDFDLHKRDKKGDTALMIAIRNQQWQIAATILLAPQPLAPEMKWSASEFVILAIQQSHIEALQVLTASKTNYLELANSIQKSPLVYAIENNKITEATAMLSDNHQKALDEQQSPLHLAVLRQNVDLVKLLLELKMDVNAKDKNGNTPLHLTTQNNQVDLLALLASYRADLNLPNNVGSTSLHLAAQSKYNAFAKKLIELKANLNPCDKEDKTPAMLAALNGNVELTQSFARADVDFDFKNSPALKSPTEIALQKRDISLYAAMRRITPRKDWNFAQIAAWTGDKVILKIIAKDKLFDLNILDSQKWTLADMAAWTGKEGIIKILGEHKANINRPDPEGITPTHLAATKCHIKVIKAFIEQDVNFKSVCSKGNTPAHSAMLSNLPNKRDVIMELLQHDQIDIHAKNKNESTVISLAIKNKEWNIAADLLMGKNLLPQLDFTPQEVLLLAIMKNHLPTLSTLIQNGVELLETLPPKEYKGELASVTQNALNPMHMAVSQNNSTLIEKVHAHKNATRFLNQEDKTGVTPLQLAIMTNKDIEVIQCLLNLTKEKIALKPSSIGKSALTLAIELQRFDVVAAIFNLNPQQAKTQKWNLSHLAIQSNLGISDILDFEKEHKIDWKQKDASGKTAMHLAVEQGNLELLKILLDKGVDFTLEDTQGMTPTHLAVQLNKPEVVKLLLTKVDFHKPNSAGKSPFLLAHESKHYNLIAIMLDVDTREVAQRKLTTAHIAAKKGCPHVMKIILDAKVDFYQPSQNNDTPLHIAVENNHSDIVKMLLNEKHISHNIKNDDGLMPLSYAIQQAKWECVAIMLAHPHPAPQKEWSSTEVLRYALELKHLAAIQAFADNRIDFSTLPGANGKSMLIESIESKQIGLSAAMLNINPLHAIKLNWNPLQLAVASGSLELFNQLKSHFNLQVRDSQGANLAHIATQFKHIDTIQMLANSKIDFTVLDTSNRSSLNIALRTEQWDIAVLMLLSMSVKQSLISEEEDAIAANRTKLREAFIAMANRTSPHKREELTTSVVEGQNKLGMILKTPASLVKRLFSKDEAEDIIVIKRELKYQSLEIKPSVGR